MNILSSIILFICLSCNSLFSQNVNFEKVEKELILEFENYINSDYDTRYNNLRPKLKKKVETVLSIPESFTYNFDSLSKYMTIIQSNNDKVKMFSWDELTGGSWHDMAVIVQFKTKDQKIKTQWIDSDISEEVSGLTDAAQYEINDVIIDNKVHYLCFGRGTYGSGHHHKSILIFSIENGTIQPCESSILKDYSTIQATRRDKINLSYDKEKQEISFNEFKYNDDIGFFEATGKRIKLKLKGGKFSE